jgi:hypothetical protein
MRKVVISLVGTERNNTSRAYKHKKNPTKQKEKLFRRIMEMDLI